MRIALVNWTSRLAGGAEQYLGAITPALADAGHTVALWSESDDPPGRPRIIPNGSVPSWSAAALGPDDAILALGRWRPDVLYCQGSGNPAIEEQLLDVAPAVFSAHGYYGTCISGAKSWKFPDARPCSRRFGPGCLVHFYPHRCGGLNPATMVRDYRRQRARQRLLHQYAAIVTHSLHMRDEYLRNGFPPDRVHGLPFPVAGTDAERPVRESYAGGARRLAFIGRMDPLKGGELLLEALGDVRSTLDLPVQVTFAGDGPERAKWERLATAVSRRARVSIRFTGWLPRPEIEQLLQATDLLVLPSVWPEPFGQVGAEAGAFGVPVAAFATGGIPDWLEDGVNGFMAPGDAPRAADLAEAIVRCLKDPQAYARLRVGARESARRYSLARHIPGLVSILEQAVRAAPRRSGGRRPLRILVAHNVRCQEPGGMSRIMNLIHDRVERAGHEVDYLCAEDAGSIGQGRLARFRYPFLVWRKARAAEREGHPYDIINVHEPSAAAVSGFRRGISAAIVVTSHGVEQRAWEVALEEKRLGRSGPGWKSRLWHPLTSLWQSEVALSKADQVFCLNEEDRAYLTRRFEIPGERILRIYPGADAIFSTAAAGRDYSTATQLLFAGTWRKNKGIEDFVPAFVRLAAEWPSLTLLVAGAGVPVESVREHFPEELRLRVDTVHTSTDAATAEVYAKADLFVLPSLFEGTPLTLMEGMMSGLPIVTTDTSGMKDVIAHERTGLLVPVRSSEAIFAAVNRLLLDPGERARLGQAAQAEARERYTWDRVSEPVLATYLHLAERKR